MPRIHGVDAAVLRIAKLREHFIVVLFCGRLKWLAALVSLRTGKIAFQQKHLKEDAGLGINNKGRKG